MGNSNIMLSLDSESIPWRQVVLGFTIANYAFNTYVSYRQISLLKKKGDVVPAELEPFKHKIDSKIVTESKNYSIEKMIFSCVASLYDTILNVVFISCDALPKLWNISGNLITYLQGSVIGGFISSGVIAQSMSFLAVYSLLTTILSLPVGWYSNFVLEEKYGFNKLTYSLWISDKLKTIALSYAIGGPLIGALLWIIDWFGKEKFVSYVTAFVFIFQILAIIIYPKFIQPLFNKLDPLEEGELKTGIEALAEKNKFPLGELWVIDGSKRSGHSNAYFMGLPFGKGIKQIVLYDTLIHNSTVEEVIAVLGHEIGHWAMGHTVKLMAISIGHIWSVMTLFRSFVDNSSLYADFGFTDVKPVIIGFMLFGDILTPVDAGMEFAMHYITRKFEYEADKYAVDQGMGAQLESALVSLHKENLSALVVDPLFSAKEHSHPTLVERISRIEDLMAEKKEK